MSDVTDFVTLVATGRARLEDIDDYIDHWHDGISTEKLYEFLGLSRDQYAIWLNQPEMLREFCNLRRRKLDPITRYYVKSILGPDKHQYHAAYRYRQRRLSSSKPFQKDVLAMKRLVADKKSA